VWSSTFDPGANANLRKAGSSYYDKPTGDEKSVRQMHLDSEKEKPSSPNAAGKPGVDAEDVRRMFSPDRVEQAMKQSSDASGKVNMDRLMESLRSSGN